MRHLRGFERLAIRRTEECRERLDQLSSSASNADVQRSLDSVGALDVCLEHLNFIWDRESELEDHIQGTFAEHRLILQRIGDLRTKRSELMPEVRIAL
jgi:hypothetical protein